MYRKGSFTEKCHGACFDCDECYSCENYDTNMTPEAFCEMQGKIQQSFEKDGKTITKSKRTSKSLKTNVKNKMTYEGFIRNTLDEIVNKYYKLGYENRRVVKYLYNDKHFASRDYFYVSGAKQPKNILTMISEMKKEKFERVNSFVRQIKTFEIGHLFALNKYSLETGSMFSLDIIAGIDERIVKDESTKKYYIKNIQPYVDKLKSNSKIKDFYSKYLDSDSEIEF